MHIFTKMETETQMPHAHAFIAEFVNKYEAFIKPSLEKGSLEAKPVIMEVCARFGIFEKIKPALRSEIYAKYKMVMQYLGGCLEYPNNVRKEDLESLATTMNRFVAELDMALEDDPNYEANRRRVA